MFTKLFVILMLPFVTFALNLKDAKHLMDRTSFGLTQKEFQILKNKNKKEAVNWLINQNKKDYEPDLPSWANSPLIKTKPMKKMSTQERKIFRQKYRKRVLSLKIWWLKTMLKTETPLREKMTLFWHNHFTSSIKKVRSPYLMLKQNELLRQNALGNFGVFLHVISKDPAMILYLDNQSNKKQKANENFAREVMELFTLGVGHYSEKDVKESARAYTGWHVNLKKMKFVYVKKFHDYHEKSFLGENGNFDGDDVLNIILKKKQTAKFITLKFYKEFINDNDINQSEIARISDIFYRSNYDISTLLKEILLSPEFWSEKNRAVLVKSPVELIVGTLRALDIQPKNVKSLVYILKQLKQDLFDPPNVKGWSSGVDWLDSSSVLLRNQTISRFTRGKEMGKKVSMMMQEKENFTFKKGISKNKKIEFFKEYFLPMDPIHPINHKYKIKKIIANLLKDPVYQLK
ncbi:MAG: DUF1800 domain-containing protein [Epsilonproteobacteria bacterium]|nr:DUF1800 domain-containing protein [Campylobacterota bacterium]